MVFDLLGGIKGFLSKGAKNTISKDVIGTILQQVRDQGVPSMANADYMPLLLAQGISGQQAEIAFQSFTNPEIAGNADAIATSINNATSAGLRFGDVLSNVGRIGSRVITGLATGLASAGISMALSAFIGLVIKIGDNIIHYNDKIIEKGQEAQKSIQETYDEFKKQDDSIKDIATTFEIDNADTNSAEENLDALAKKYAELKKGVNDFTNANERLSTDQYQEYLDISNKLSKQFPTLVKGYDAQGNAILDLGSNVSDCSERMLGLYEAAENVANVEIGNKLKDQFAGYREEIIKYRKELEGLADDIADVEEEMDGWREIKENGSSDETVDDAFEQFAPGSYMEFQSQDHFNKFNEMVQKQYGEEISLGHFDGLDMGVEFEGPIMVHLSDNFGVEFTDADKDVLKGLYKKANNEIANEALNELNADMLEKSDEQLASENYIKDLNAKMQNSIKNQLDLSASFGGINKEIQSAILSNLSIFDLDYMANNGYDINDDEAITKFIYKQIIDPFTSLGEEAQRQIQNIFSKDSSDMSVEQYKEYINNIISGISNGDDELAQQLKDILGLDNKWQEFSEMRRKILYSFDDLSQEDRTEIYNSNIQDIIKMYDLLTSKEMGYYDTYSKLAREASYVTTLPSEGTLADVLESEKFTTEADKIEKKITAINNAISSIKENGILQGDAKTSFLAEIGEDYAGDLNNVADLQKEGGKYISQWISLLYEQGKAADLSSTAFKALTEYANGFIQTYENMNIDKNTVSQMLWSTAPEFYVSNKDEFEEEFSEELQDPEKRKILFSVIANTDRANLSLETLREEYDKTEINYELKVQVDEFNKEMKQIEARISDAQYKANMASSRRQLDNARGIYSNDERYINEQVQARKDEIDEINKQIQSYINGTNPESVMFKRNEGYTEEQLEEVRIAQRKALQDLKNQKISIKIDIEGLEDEKLLLPMQSVENELSVLQGEASKFQDIMNDSSTPTGIETYSDAIKNADEQLELLYAEETFYQELLNNSALDETGEKYIGFNDKLNTIQSTIRELIKSQNEWNKAIVNMPIDNARAKLEVLDTKMQQLQADQAQKQASGLSLTAEDFDEQNRILEDEIKAQQDIIETATQNRAEQLHIGEDIFDPLRNIKSQNKNLGPKRPVPDAFDFEGIKNQTTEVTNATKAITEAQTNIIENNSQKAGLGLKYIQNAMQDLENEASKLNDILNDDSHKTTIDDYSNAIKNAQDRLSNLHLQEVEILTQLADLRSKIEEKESTENGGDGFTESDLYKNDDYVALKNDLVSVQTEMKNAQDQTHEWQKAIDNFNVNSMEEEIERLETDLQVLQRGVDLRSAMGFDKTAEDYKQEDAILEEEIKRRTERAGILQEEYSRKLMSGVFKYGSKEETDAWNDITAALDSVNSSKVQLAQNKRAEATLGSDIIQKQLTGVTNAAENTTRAINELVNQGLTGTEEQYQEAMSFLSAQYTLQDKLIADLENQLENRMAELNEKGWNPEDFIKDTIYNEIITQINSAKSAQVELNNTFREYLLMLNGGIELNKLQSDLDKLKEVETQYTDAISLAQSRNQSTPLSLTTGLVENRLNQVENIKGQIGQLEKQLLIPGTTSKQFDEILSKIRTLESELANMTPNIEQGIKEIQNYATAVATSMNSAVSAAVSETASDQGMSRETIETLTNQFRELASVTNIDLSSMFYNSAKGIKVNTRALEGLLKIQNQVYGKGMMNVVNKYLNGIRTQINGINLLGQAERNEAKQTLEGYRAKLRGMNKQLAGYNTLMEATEKMTDRFAKWQEAVNSENPGDRYDQFASQAGEYEKMRNEGKVGTDEFKAWTALMNYYGHGSAQAYDYQHDLMMRYLFEGPEGAWTFANDMVSNGHGTRTELGGFIFDTLNLEEIARELDISVELAEMLIGKAKDYGAEIEIVNNEIDGTVLQEEKSVDLIKELETLAKEQVQGADMKWIMESNGNIIGLEDMIKKLQVATEEYHLAPLFDEEEYAIQVKYLQNLKEEMDLLGKDNPILYDKLATELERVAQEYHITLDADYNITEADYNKSLEKREEYLRNMQGYLPDFDRVLDEFGNDLGEGYVTQYRNAIDEIENIARTEGLGDIKLNFDYDSASLDEINQHMLDLEDLDVVIDGEESPALKETLNRLHNMAEIEFKLATIVQTDNTSGGDLTIEKLAQMEDQDAINLIINTGVASTDDAEAILQLARSKAAEIPMTIKIDDAQLEQILGRIGNRITEESEKAPSYKIPIEMKDGLDELRGQVNEAMNDGLINDISDVFGENIQTVFGNIDMNARETLTWTDETIAKYHDMAEKLGVSVGDASTVLGSWNQFRIQDPTSEDIYPLELSVAYTPLLQTGTGTPQVLDENTISQYIQSIMKKATEVVYDENGIGHTEINKAFMFDLDKEGMYVGDTFIKGIIAEIDTDLEAGNMADKVSRLMHFSGDFGSIQPIIDQIHELGEAIGMPKEAIDELIRKYTEFGELTSNVNVSSEWDVTAPLEAGLDRANNKLSTLNERLAEAKTITINPEVADDVIVIDPDKVDFDAEATADKIKEAISLAIDIANQRSEDKEAIVDINGDSTKEKEEAQNAKTDIETNMNPTVDLLVDTDQANSTVNRFREEVKNNPFTVILEPMNDLITKIQNMLNSNRLTVNVDPIVSNVQTTVQNALPEVVAPQNYFSNLPIQYFAHGTLGAYANGSDGVKNGQLTHDEDALVNELGNEAIIRDGQLHIIPGGMHVEHLRKGDVILNHKQVKALQETGEAPGHGKIVGGESAFTHGTCLNDDDKLKLALASGTVYDGISAYAGFSSSGHMGVGSWGGGINQANYTGLQERFGMIDDTVDDLDDFDDAINDILDDLNDLDDHIQPSFQTIDLVQRRLQYFSNATKKIADQITEFIDTATKRTLLTQEIDAIQNEIYANSRAASVYWQEALKTGYDFKYYDTDKNQERYIKEQIIQQKQYMVGVDQNSQGYKDMNNNLRQLERALSTVQETPVEYHVRLADYFDLNRLRNGDYNLQEIDTSTSQGQALYDAAQSFINMSDNATNAASQIQQLSNQLRQLYSDMINLPFEDLEKALGKLEMKMQTINSFMSATTGGAAIAALSRRLTQMFGKETAQAMINTNGKTYEVQNRLIQQNVTKLREQSTENLNAYNASMRTFADLQRQYDIAKSDLSGVKWLVGGMYMDAQDRSDFNSGKLLDTSHFNANAELVAEYNKRLSKLNNLTSALTESEEKMQEQLEKTKQSAAEAAQAVIDGIRSTLSNIQNYFNSYIDFSQAKLDSSEAGRDNIINWNGYLRNQSQIINSYSSDMGEVSSQMGYLQESIRKQQAALNRRLSIGDISSDDEEYREFQGNIIRDETNLKNLQNTYNQLYKDMVNVPNEALTEKLNEIAEAYRDVSDALSNNVADSQSSIRVYERLAAVLRKVNGSYTNSALERIDSRTHNTYQAQNKLLETDTEKSQDELVEAIKTQTKTARNLEAAKRSGNNQLIKAAKEANEVAKQMVSDKLNETTLKQVNNAVQAVLNIDEYFKKIIDFQDTMNRADEIVRNHIIETGNVAEHEKELIDGYTQSTETLWKDSNKLIQSIADMQTQLDYNIERGFITVGDEKWMELTKTIQEDKNALIENKYAQIDNYKKMLEIPSKIASEKIDKITQSYKELNAAMNANIQTSSTAINLLRQFSDITGIGGLNSIRSYEDDLFSSSNHDSMNSNKLYLKQNQMIVDNLNQEREKLEPMLIERAKLDAEYNELLRQRSLLEESAANNNGVILSDGLIVYDEQIEAAKKAIEDIDNDILAQQDKVVQMYAESLDKMMQFINEYFQTYLNHQDQIRANFRSIRDYTLETSTYIANGSKVAGTYVDEINSYGEDAALLLEQASAMKAQLEEGLRTGAIDSYDAIKYQDQIDQLTNTAREKAIAQQQAFKELVSIPAKITEESLARIEKSYAAINAAIDAGVTNSIDKMRILNEMNEVTGADNYRYDTSKPVFVEQNRALRARLDQSREELGKRYGEMVATARVLEEVKNQGIVDEGELKKATEAADNAYKEYVRIQADTTSLEVETAVEAINNIDAYYKSLAEFNATIGDQLEKIRNYIMETSSYIRSSVTYMNSYKDQIIEYNKQYAILEKAIEMINAQLQQGMLEGAISIDDQNYRDAINKITSLQNEMIAIRSSQQKLFKELVNVPNETVAEKVEAIAKAYTHVTSAISAGITETKAMQRNYANISKAFLQNNPYTAPISGVTYEKGQTFVGQNQALVHSLNESQLELIAYNQAVYETGKNYQRISADAYATEGEIRSALEAYETALQNFVDKETELAAKEVSTAQKIVQNIGQYYNSLQEYNENLAQSYEKVRDVLDELGRGLTFNGELLADNEQIVKSYRIQLSLLQTTQNNVAESIAMQEAQLKLLKDILQTDTEEYREIQGTLNGLRQTYMELTISIDQLQDEMRQKLYLRPIEEAIEKVQRLQNTLSGLNDLISEEAKLTEDGEYTQLGKVSLALDTAQYTQSLKELQEAQEYYATVSDRYLKDASYSGEEYMQDMQKASEQILKAMQNVNSAREAMLAAEKNRLQTEINYINKLIDAQKKELSKKKELADYDKQMKKKNNSIMQLENEIKALEGLMDAESVSKKKRLEEQLEEAKEDRQDTIEQHIYDLRNENLDKMSEHLDDMYQDYVKDLAINIGNIIDTVNKTSDNLASCIGETNAALNTWLQTFQPGLNAAMVFGINKFTKDNANYIPNRELIEKMANSMVDYADNLSPQEFDRIHMENQAIVESNQHLGEIIPDETNRVASAFSGISESFDNSIFASSEKEIGQINKTGDNISGNINNVNSTISNVDDNINNTLFSSNQATNEAISAGANNINGSLNNISNGFDGSIDKGANNINQSIHSDAENINNGLYGLRTDNTMMLEQQEKLRQQQALYQKEQASREVQEMQNYLIRNQLVLDSILESDRDITSVMDTSTGKINTVLNGSITSINSILNDTKSGLSTNLNYIGKNIGDSANSIINNDKELNNRIINQAKSADDNMNRRSIEANQNVNMNSNNIQDTISEGDRKLNQNISNNTSEISSGLNNITTGFGTSISNASYSINNGVNTGVSNITQQLLSDTNLLNNSVSGGISNINKRLFDDTTEVKNTLTNIQSTIGTSINDGNTLLNSTIGNKSDSINASLGNISTGFDTAISSGSSTIKGSIDSTYKFIDDSYNSLTKMLEDKYSEINTNITGDDGLKGSLESGVSSVSDVISNSKSDLSEDLLNIHTALTNTDDDSLIGNIVSQGGAIDDSLAAVYSGLTDKEGNLVGGILAINNNLTSDAEGSLIGSINSGLSLINGSLTSDAEGTLIGTLGLAKEDLIEKLNTINTSLTDPSSGTIIGKLTSGFKGLSSGFSSMASMIGSITGDPNGSSYVSGIFSDFDTTTERMPILQQLVKHFSSTNDLFGRTASTKSWDEWVTYKYGDEKYDELLKAYQRGANNIKVIGYENVEVPNTSGSITSGSGIGALINSKVGTASLADVYNKLDEVNPVDHVQEIGTTLSGEGGIKSILEAIKDKTNDYSSITTVITDGLGKDGVSGSIEKVKEAIDEIPNAISGFKIDIPDPTNALNALKNSVEEFMKTYKPTGSTIRENTPAAPSQPSYTPAAIESNPGLFTDAETYTPTATTVSTSSYSSSSSSTSSYTTNTSSGNSIQRDYAATSVTNLARYLTGLGNDQALQKITGNKSDTLQSKLLSMIAKSTISTSGHSNTSLAGFEKEFNDYKQYLSNKEILEIVNKYIDKVPYGNLSKFRTDVLPNTGSIGNITDYLVDPTIYTSSHGTPGIDLPANKQNELLLFIKNILQETDLTIKKYVNKNTVNSALDAFINGDNLWKGDSGQALIGSDVYANYRDRLSKDQRQAIVKQAKNEAKNSILSNMVAFILQFDDSKMIEMSGGTVADVLKGMTKSGKYSNPSSSNALFTKYLYQYNNIRDAVTNDEIQDIIRKYIDEKGTTSVKNKYTKSLLGFAKGTLSAPPGLAQVFEKGPEIITTKKGTFVPFTGGEGVIPADLTKNLVKMALLMKDGGFELKMPDMSNYKTPEPKQNVTNTSEINIGSLITINGNADENTVDQIREIAQSLVKNRQFQENVTKFVSARQTADGIMAGKRKAIR